MKAGTLLKSSRVYLSGPMDFVASRAYEKKYGWRNRIGEFLASLGVTVFDPWIKPGVRGFPDYGYEGEATTQHRDEWTFAPGPKGARARARCAQAFWPSMHIDLRMVDASDFIVAYCPTNIYSVGTVHEIVIARQQRKPVLFVSPYVEFKALVDLRKHLAGDRAGTSLLEKLEAEVPIKPNPTAAPSLWYMPLVGREDFFDGFGFKAYRRRFPHWRPLRLDEEEERRRPRKPLLPFLEECSRRLPKKWDRHLGKLVANDDWMLFDPAVRRVLPAQARKR
jgi:hypothetical protein